MEALWSSVQNDKLDRLLPHAKAQVHKVQQQINDHFEGGFRVAQVTLYDFHEEIHHHCTQVKDFLGHLDQLALDQVAFEKQPLFWAPYYERWHRQEHRHPCCSHSKSSVNTLLTLYVHTR